MFGEFVVLYGNFGRACGLNNDFMRTPRPLYTTGAHKGASSYTKTTHSPRLVN